MPIGVLKIPLGASLRGSTKRLYADLWQIVKRVNVVRNAVLWKWMSWCKENGYMPVQQVDKDGLPRTFRGKPFFQLSPLPNRMPSHLISCKSCKGTGINAKKETCVNCEGKGEKEWIGGSGWLARHAAVVAPDLPGQMSSAASASEYKKLSAKVLPRHEGNASLRWHAYLLHEYQLPNCRGFMIPVQSQSSAIVYTGSASRDVQKNLRSFGQSDCVLIMPIWGQESGRADKTMIVRLRIGALSEGQRVIIRRVCRGEWKIADSSIVYHDNDRRPAWYLHLVYDQPEKDLGLDNERGAVLSCTPTGDRPFRLECAEFGRAAGKVRTLVVRRERLEDKRMYLRNHYKDSAARRGHGRNRVELTIRPITRRLNNLMVEFSRQLVNDAMAFCVRNNCGKLTYREPSMGSRPHSWFAKKDMPFDWTALRTALEQKCELNGIVLEVVCERKGGAEIPGVARVPERHASDGHTSNGHANGNGKAGTNGKPLAKGIANRVKNAVGKAGGCKL